MDTTKINSIQSYLFQMNIRILFFESKKDKKHSKKEERFFCTGNNGNGIMTVRFTERNKNIRIIGAGYWREGRYRYEKENKLH